VAAIYKSLTLRQRLLRGAGLFGSAASIGIFLSQPSFLTPDKLLVFGLFLGLLLGQAKGFFVRLAPFVALLLAYESFRGLVPSLNQRVNFTWMVDVDRWLFGGELPTKTLQEWWWNGQVQWYDFAFYLPYMLHFVLPFALAVYVWKKHESEYWRYVTAFVGISFAAFVVFLVFPAAPPWMASEKGYIEPITRISSSVWFELGIKDFPSVYNDIAPNPVAAVPSLHAGYATLFALFVMRYFSGRLKYAVWIYPVLIWVGTVYQGEHYAIDEILGALLALAGYFAAPYILNYLQRGVRILRAIIP
jgi:hypothetical protein